MRTTLGLLILLGACGSKGDKAANGSGGSASPPVSNQPFAGPMPITYGDCADATVAWVSGPKPLPFTRDEANGNWDMAAAVAAANGPDDPPPPPEEDKPDDGSEESGGTGTAMALDEGKMGKKDSDRAEGQYRMKNTNVDPSLARQQAIEQARKAGILSPKTQGGAFATLTGTGDIDSGFDDVNIYGGLLGNEVGEMQGGFGYGIRGDGKSPSGGTGWGTIGTGRYGTIGHGNGSGYGYGVAGGGHGTGKHPPPSTTIGQPSAVGDLDKAIIRRYIKRNLPKIQYCYEKQLLADSKLEGTVLVQFFITPNGSVAASSGNGVHPEVASCVASVIKAIEFPKPKGGGGVQVNYPFQFRNGREDDDPKPAAGSGSAVAKVDPPKVDPPKVVDPPKPTARTLFRDADHGRVGMTGYVLGDGNPLRPQNDALEACFRRDPKHFGAIVVELDYDASGATKGAKVHGVDDAATAQCIVDAAKLVKRAKASGSERCSIAYGEMPAAAQAALEIGPADLVIAGTKVASIAEVEKQDAPSITTLDERLHALSAPILAQNGPVVAMHGPYVARIADTAPIKSVVYALATTLRAGDDFVLATKRGNDWKLMKQTSLPIVPVPYGTGGLWAPVKGRGGHADDEENVVLSILVQKEDVWVGMSRVNEFQQIKRDANFATAFEKALADQKKSAFFADRDDIEIAGEEVPWADVVMAVDAAEKVGFKNWVFSDAAGLAAKPTL